MKLIKANYEIIPQKGGLIGIYKSIELPARVCYGSIDKICDGSAEKMVGRLENANHGAPMEHGTVYLDCPQNVFNKYVNNKYSKVNYHKTGNTYISTYGYNMEETKWYVTTNYRVIFENGWKDDLQYICEPTEYHEKRIMVKFSTDIGVSREYNRHRHNSMNEGSTRYCDITKDKFGGGSIKFILPPWVDDSIEPIDEKDWRNMCGTMSIYNDTYYFTDIDYWLFSLKTAEYCYNNLRRLGWLPQQARNVLPLGIFTPLIHTAFISDWIHFFNLRALGTTGAPHPQAKELAEPLMNTFIELGYIKFDENNKLVMV